MLGKLIKYEFKSTARIFIPIYAVLLFFSVLGNFALGDTFAATSGGGSFGELISGIVMFAYVMIIFSVIIVTAVVILQRFYKNLTGDEGYLMHTLPVSAHGLIQSKLIVAFVWEAASIAMVLLSVFILCFQPYFFADFADFCYDLGGLMQLAFSEMGISIIINIILFMLIMVVATLCGTLFIYAAISIGHTFKKHRILASVGAYMVMNMICQFVTGTLFAMVSVSTSFDFDFSYMSSPAAVSGLMSVFMLTLIAGQLLFGGVFYFITYYVLTRRLNLE